MKQLVKVPPTKTEVTVEINIPDTLVVIQTGGTPIDPPVGNLPPVVNAGANQVITLPTNSVILNGTGQDPDGTIKNIKWEKVSGGAVTIVNPTSLVTQITGLVAGMYVFKLTLTDDDNDIASSTTNVEVKAAVVVPPPSTFVINGYGALVTGGQGQEVVHCTNLSQLASMIRSNRIILIDVSGNISESVDIENIQNLTIDCYSTKQDVSISGVGGDGMYIYNSNNIIIRGLRIKNCNGDCIGVNGSSSNIVLDHCSAYGGGDGNIDFAAAAGKNFTMQWCFLGNNNGSGRNLGTTINASIHHCFYASGSNGEGAERNPFFHANYSPKGTQSNPNFDFVNNLVAASGRYASGCGYGAVGNFINSYYVSNKSGLINLDSDSGNPGKAHVSGNFNQSSPVGGNSSAEYTIPARYQIKRTDAVTAAQAIKQSVGTWKRDNYEQGELDKVIISGGSTPTNQPPGANAGADQSLPSGTTSATITGIGTDSDGNVASVVWSKVSGSGTIASPNAASTSITGLTSGTSVFQFKVTDDKGATATDNVTINIGTVTPPDPDSGYPGYTKVFSDYFNKDSDLDPHDHGQAGNGFIDYADKFEGAGSFASRVANVSSGIRSEVQLDASSTPKEALAVYYVKYKNFFSNSGHSVQLHPDNDGSGTGFYHVNGKLVFRSVTSGTDTYKDYPFNYTPPLNKWIKVEWYYKWAKTGGYCKVVIDGVTYVNATNIAVGDGSDCWFKLGVNMWVNQTSNVNYDKFDLYKKD